MEEVNLGMLLNEIRGLREDVKQEINSLKEGQQGLIGEVNSLKEGQQGLINRIDSFEKETKANFKLTHDIIYNAVNGIEKEIKEIKQDIKEIKEDIGILEARTDLNTEDLIRIRRLKLREA